MGRKLDYGCWFFTLFWNIDNFSGYDPEVNMDGQSNGARGGIMGLVPIPSVIKFGVIATF